MLFKKLAAALFFVSIVPFIHGEAYEDNYLYLQANVGYAYNPWQSTFGSLNYTNSVGNTSWGSGNNAFAFGFNIGYQAYKHMGIELGYFGITDAALKSNDSSDFGFTKASFYTNDIYLAARALLPMTENFQLFGKAGVHTKFIAGGRGAFNRALGYREQTVVGPMFAAGMQYMFSDDWGLNLQYLYLSGQIKNINAIGGGTTSVNPNAQLVTLGVIYNICLE